MKDAWLVTPFFTSQARLMCCRRVKYLENAMQNIQFCVCTPCKL